MLISFTLENWRSFKDASTLNLVATTEEQHSERLPKSDTYKFRLLPTVAIYGGNASGKSNFFKGLHFAQWMVTKGPSVDGGIPLDTFRPDKLHKPSRFGFVIRVKDEENLEQIYDYSFALNRTRVLEEKLVWVKKSSEIVLFERRDEVPAFHRTIRQDKVLLAVLESTRENQLYLTNVASQNLSRYKTKQVLQVIRWFKKLVLIDPDTKFVHTSQGQFREDIGAILALLGTGIEKLELQKTNVDGLNLPQDVIDDIKAEFMAGAKNCEVRSRRNRYEIYGDNGELVAQKLVSVHRGGTVFDIEEESDGTLRVMDLLPCFLGAARQNSTRVFVIDELDRSLHTLLVKQLLESYLASCSPESQSQIIFTTHDVLQMDQNLLRRDEMWVTDRKKDGSTELVPLSSFKEIRKDKSIRTSYLRGQLGGVPKLLLGGVFPQEIVEEEPQ